MTQIHRVLWDETQQVFGVQPDESVLQAALRQDVPIPHDCTYGGCGTCRMQVLQGRIYYPDDELPMSLSEEDRAAGYAQACLARPCSDLVMSIRHGPECSAPTVLQARVAEIAPLTPTVWHLALELPADHGVVYAPGQYLKLHLPDRQTRSFSMANAPQGDRITLQIRRIPGGRFTDGVLPRVQVGDVYAVEMPHGVFHCHASDYQAMVFAATGTGFAPIRAILESLLGDEDCPPIHFYWGARVESDLYLAEEIQGWVQRFDDFTFVPVLSRADAGWSGRHGHVQDAIASDFDDLGEYSIYLCGSPKMVRDAKAMLALSGARPDRIYSDSFTFQSGTAAKSALV